MEQGELLEGGESAQAVEARRQEQRAARKAEREATADQAPARVCEADRSQIELRPLDIDSLIPLSHRARAVWSFVERLELSALYTSIRARGSRPGRPMTDPKILLTLWLYAISEGIGSARRIDRLCREHNAFRWICGGVLMNYHTLADFRVDHDAVLDDLLTQSLAVMTQQGILRLKRTAQDGTRVRASAGGGSLRRRASLQEHLGRAREQVEALKKQSQDEVDTQRTARQKAAQERAARERAERLEKALAELAKIEKLREDWKGGKKPTSEPRASVTDPEARKMKMANGSFRPAYNAQIATDTENRVIVGVAITEDGTDYAHAAPMIDQIEKRTGTKPEQHLIDGGFLSKQTVEEVTRREVELFGPPPHRKTTPDPYMVKGGDSAAVIQWKQRMRSSEGQTIYKQRGSTIETINADLKQWRTLGAFTVRGKRKVLCVLLLNALAYNILRWTALMSGT